MIKLLTGKTLDDLTILVQESMNSLGASGVRFVIRPLHYEVQNWYIDAELSVTKLRKDELTALASVGAELRTKYYLLLSDAPSPYAA
jgi:hypothetical protein